MDLKSDESRIRLVMFIFKSWRSLSWRAVFPQITPAEAGGDLLLPIKNISLMHYLPWHILAIKLQCA